MGNFAVPVWVSWVIDGLFLLINWDILGGAVTNITGLFIAIPTTGLHTFFSGSFRTLRWRYKPKKSPDSKMGMTSTISTPGFFSVDIIFWGDGFKEFININLGKLYSYPTR